MSSSAPQLVADTLLAPSGLGAAELRDAAGQTIARFGNTGGADARPVVFEGVTVGWLVAPGESEALARLVAPLLACPDRGLALSWLGAIARLRATHPHIDWIGVYRLDAGDLVIAAQLPIAADHLRMPPDGGISWQAVRGGEPVYVADATTRPDFVPCEFPTRTSLVVPIKTPAGEVVAALEVDALVADAYPPAVRDDLQRAVAGLHHGSDKWCG